MFNFKKLISLPYLFDVNTVMLTRSDKLFFMVGACIAVLGIGLRLFSWRTKNLVDKKLLRRLAKLFLTVGLLEVLWFAMRYENIRFFGTHFAALFIYLIGLIWAIFLVKYYFTGYRREKVDFGKQQLKQKYLN